VSGKISLDHRFTDDFMAYVAYNRGFKSGLFNVVSIFAPLDPPVKPETLDAVSIGEKAEFLDHRLRINAEAFYYKFKNIQVQSVVNGTSHASNAAKATLKGLEIDVTAVPAEHLTLTGSIGVEEGKFDEFPDGAYVVYDPVHGGNCALSPTNTCGLVPGGPGAPPGYTGTSWSLAGNKTPNTPPFSASLSAKYDIPTSVGPFDVNVAWNHTGNYYFSPDNGQGQIGPSQPSFDKQKLLDIINASIGWTSENGHMGVRLWGKNISDVHYLAFGIETSDLTSWSAAPPRTFGITLSSHF
jgi:iron complex outermembrane receptor protein